MRFGVLHRVLVDALATLGLLSLAGSGVLPPITSLLVLLGLRRRR